MENNLPVVTNMTTKTSEIELKAQQQEAFMDIQNKMMWITQEMQENPLPPSNQINKGDTNQLTKVEMPPEGGVLTYMSGYDVPFQGFPFHELVERMDVVKKMTKGFKSGFHHLVWKHFAGWKRIPMIWFTTPFFRVYTHAEIATCWRYIERYKIKPKMYCTALREVHRAFTIPIDDNERQKTRELREHIRDLFCMHLEFDNAYRFRFQDIIVELNKIELKKDPVKEIIRLFDLMSGKEVRQEVKDSWTLTKTMVEYLRYSKEIKSIVISFLNNLDTDKCKLDKFDYPFCAGRVDYKFNNPNIKQTI